MKKHNPRDLGSRVVEEFEALRAELGRHACNTCQISTTPSEACDVLERVARVDDAREEHRGWVSGDCSKRFSSRRTRSVWIKMGFAMRSDMHKVIVERPRYGGRTTRKGDNAEIS